MINRIHKYYGFLFAVLVTLLATSNSQAQETEEVDPYAKVVQLSGIILGSDSTNGVPGVHIYSPVSGRGTTTNPYGYFSAPFLMGDSVVVSSLGYEKQSFIVPSDKGNSVSVVIELRQDTTFLEEIQVFPYPTEELFKEAILALELPYAEDLNSLDDFLREDVLRRTFWQLEPSAAANHRFFMEQQFQATQQRFQIPANPLLNPLAWSRFIRSIKRGDLKRKRTR